MSADDPAWTVLDRELESWRSTGRHAPLWWRDDDAVAATPALSRLLQLSGEERVPVCLAVIPARFSRDLVSALMGSDATVVAHGHAHENHAPADAKKAEFGADRPLPAMAGELADGRQRIHDAFGPRARPVFVPPWNRMTDSLLPHLAPAGFTGLSAKGPRPVPRVTGVTVRDVSVDIIDWRGGRGFLGLSTVLAQIVDGLRRRRLGEIDPDQGPLGILTHHLVQDDAAWSFLAALCGRVERSGAARWLDVDAVFAAGR